MMKQHHSLGALALIVVPITGLMVGIGMSPAVSVNKITVIAPEAGLGEDVRQHVKLPPNASALFYPLNRLTAQVRQCPRVKTVSAERLLPHELRITVTEREPFAVLADSGSYTVISRDGYCLYRVAQPPPKLPQVTGMTVANPPLGCRMSEERLAWVTEVIAGAAKAGLQQGLRCDFTYLNHVTVVFGNGLQGTLGNVNNLARKVTIVGRVAEQLQKEGKALASVDVSTPESPIMTVKS